MKVSQFWMVDVAHWQATPSSWTNWSMSSKMVRVLGAVEVFAVGSLFPRAFLISALNSSGVGIWSTSTA